MNPYEPTRPIRLIRLPEVIDKVGLCRTAVYARIAAGKFPAPRKIGRVSVWLEDEVNFWIHQVSHVHEEGIPHA